jgi:hypothetical protein
MAQEREVDMSLVLEILSTFGPLISTIGWAISKGYEAEAEAARESREGGADQSMTTADDRPVELDLPEKSAAELETERYLIRGDPSRREHRAWLGWQCQESGEQPGRQRPGYRGTDWCGD